MVDNCITFAGASVLGACVTSEYKINCVRPAIGEYLIAKANVLYAGKRQFTCECKVFFQENGKKARCCHARDNKQALSNGVCFLINIFDKSRIKSFIEPLTS